MDSSWDNSKSTESHKSDNLGGILFKGSIVGMFVIAVFTIIIFVGHQNRPQIIESERMRARPDWAATKEIVEALKTEAGTKGLFQKYPKLAHRFKTEQAFLIYVAHWRPQLDSLPQEVPPFNGHGFGFGGGLFGMGSTLIRYRMPSGCWISLTWSGPYTRPPHQLTDFECFQ